MRFHTFRRHRTTLAAAVAAAALPLLVHAAGPGTSPSATGQSQRMLASTQLPAGTRTSSPPESIDLGDRFQGIVRPALMAELPSLVPGVIAEIHVEEGQFVRKDELLMTLDDRVPRARLEAAAVEATLQGALHRAEVDLRMAQSRIQRLSAVMQSGAGAAFEMRAAEADRDRAQAAIEQQQDILKAADANRRLAEAQLEQYRINAPFDGQVIEIHKRSGAIDPTQVIMTVADLRVLEVEMHLPSRMLGTVRPGQTVALQAGVPISGEIRAAVVSVSPMINSASNTFRCLLKIDNSEQHLPAGFSVVVNGMPDSGQRLSHSTGQSR
ncbi:MAG: efflux RND transporter periplasmic adaptor subunit [Planctomycetaceae bacterium]